MKYQNVISAINSAVWAITPEKLGEIMDFAAHIATGGTYDPVELEARFGAPEDKGALPTDPLAALYEQAGVTLYDSGVARVKVHGTIMPKVNIMSQFSGGTSTELLGKAVRALDKDDRVSRVVFDVNSPGGSVEGVSEAARAIKQMTKPTVAVGSGTMASAAYWIASSADKVYSTDTSMVGSIGVISSRMDFSEKFKSEGIAKHIWRSGEYKALGDSSEPLTEKERTDTQRLVDAFYDQFLTAIADNRFNSSKDQAKNVADGRVYIGPDAQTNNLVDGIKTVDEALAELDAEATAEQRLEAVEDSWREVQAAYEEQIMALQGDVESLEAQLAEQGLAAAEQKADTFLAELTSQGKIAPKADHTALRANLVKDFEAFSAVFDSVPAGAAGPATMETTKREVADADSQDKAIAEAKEKGLRVARDEDEASVFAEFGIDFVKGY